jgi:Holliday junction DNA helicase RuvB
MPPEESFIESSLPVQAKLDSPLDHRLRPNSLREFFGQEAVRERLDILISAAKKRKEPLPHCLFHGPPGLGKTTLAHLIAQSTGAGITVTSGPVIEKAGDLAGLLTNLKEGDVLFIDEIHRVSPAIEEYLYPAMEDFCLDLLIDTGPSARSVKVTLNRFTLVGATTRVGLLSGPLRSRFGFTSRLDYYDVPTLVKILIRSSDRLGVTLTHDGATAIGSRARGTPRIANNLLRWVRDYAETRGHISIDAKIAEEALEMLTIDHRGLDEMDKKILTTIIDHHDGGPVGLGTIAVAVGEESATLEEVYEPFLILQGFLRRTQRGREATRLAYEHLGYSLPQKLIQGDLL